MRKYISLLLISVLTLFIISSAAYANPDIKPTPNFSKDKVTKEEIVQKDPASVQVELGDSSTTNVQKSNKIRSRLQEYISNSKVDETIEIQVALDYEANITVEKFEDTFLKFFTVPIEKVSAFHFITRLNSEQIQQLVQLPDVLYVNLPGTLKPIEEPVEKEISKSDVGILVNASSEMTGAKKARSDFNVTGDRDGNETSYSKNDITIAILDTGIDTSHVDLDGGKVIGWMDFVNNRLSPYDDHGHGTGVASVAAGTGEGDPGIQEGFAPGAALVGVKIANSSGLWQDDWVLDGINWCIDHRDDFGIRVINMSIGGPIDDFNAMNDAISDANNAGIAVVVAAGNYGPDYDTLSDFVTCDDAISVGSMTDPYEGGWYPSLFSSRGTGSSGPLIMAPGDKIRMALVDSTNEYYTDSGTSFSTPAISGIIALMMDASAGSSTLNFIIEDFGEDDYDPVYGNGEVLAYNSIKTAGGFSNGSFNDYRDLYHASNTLQGTGDWHLYEVNVYNTAPSLYFATTLLMTDEFSLPDFDLFIWNPDSDPYSDPPDYSSTSTDPQETISFRPTVTGNYKVAVQSFSGSGNYVMDFSGQIN